MSRAIVPSIYQGIGKVGRALVRRPSVCRPLVSILPRHIQLTNGHYTNLPVRLHLRSHLSTLRPVLLQKQATSGDNENDIGTDKITDKDTSPENNRNKATFKADKPQYLLAFTCKKCNTRSAHTISKQAYHHGTVLVKCPHCNNRHLIADHLKIFSDTHITIQDIMRAKGEEVSTSTDDLVLEEIPESLKGLLGKYARSRVVRGRKEEKGVMSNGRVRLLSCVYVVAYIYVYI